MLKKPKPARDYQIWTFCLSAEIMKQVKDSACQNGRWCSQEIEYRLQRDFDRELIATANTKRREAKGWVK
jgi:hypothetical protein